jgi:glycosyltransferase involved in cell wall biosynthesis
MKISVIIPFYDELKLINRAVNSVLINSDIFEDTEIIIINDGFYKENDIRSNLEENFQKSTIIIQNIYAKGPGGARNTGLDVSKGDIIAFLDADDLWLPGKLKAQLQEIKKGSTFVATSYRFDSSKIKINPPHSINIPTQVFLRRGIGTSTVIITKELLENHKFRDIRYGQDIDFWFALAKSKKFKYAGISGVFVEYNTGGSTKNKWVQLLYVNKILGLNKINFLTKIRVNLSYMINGIYNHYIKKFFSNKKNYER